MDLYVLNQSRSLWTGCWDPSKRWVGGVDLSSQQLPRALVSPPISMPCWNRQTGKSSLDNQRLWERQDGEECKEFLFQLDKALAICVNSQEPCFLIKDALISSNPRASLALRDCKGKIFTLKNETYSVQGIVISHCEAVVPAIKFYCVSAALVSRDVCYY